ncbi:PPE family protein [Candidatus Mycobacterium methanotrophicum]|uniref:PPE family protein n=1 Tax=Candidatus Mycobacterium methanotrophicum TaxID=2943498 RepID=A0ABY4QGJ2_9MYCO|nr:PPE family protein [Candidatus Mycobacterium methanotrophicum]UQX09473.1 PPE family protein [Candidatus Mycobacterium methanotrophicum]
MAGVAAGLDFGVLPPEVNSGLMYAGPGPQPLTAAATAWADLAGELDSAADVCAGALSGLASDDWQGPAAASMAAAATPYTSWLQTTAGHAARAAGQAAAAVNAYENAFAATVPPAAVAANRAQLASLTATNLLGQNTAAIAATEAQYGEMWAQDAAAMYGYAAQSAAATTLNPLTTPPKVTTETGLSQQAAASTHAAAAALSTAPSALNALATGSDSSSLSALVNSLGLNIVGSGSGNSTTGLAGLINLMSGNVATPLTNAFNSSFISNEFFAGYVLYPGLFMNNIGDMTSLGTLFGRSIAPGLAAVGSTASQTGDITPTLGGLGTLVGQHALGAEVSAGVGKASLVGALSTPRSWTTAAPAAAIRLAAAVSSSPTSTPVFGVGPMGLPGMPMPGAGRGGSPAAPHSAATPRYGFRLTVLPPEPTGNATV